MPAKISYKALNSNCFEYPLRAMVEIVGGELRIFPVADSDADERRILDALRFAMEDWRP